MDLNYKSTLFCPSKVIPGWFPVGPESCIPVGDTGIFFTIPKMDQNGRFMALVSGKIYRKPWFLPSNLMGRPIGLSGENCPILKKSLWFMALALPKTDIIKWHETSLMNHDQSDPTETIHLVGGAITILKNDGVRQWEGWHPNILWKINENKTCLKPTRSLSVRTPFLAKSLAALLTGGGHRPRTLRRGGYVLCEAGHRNAGPEMSDMGTGSRSKSAANTIWLFNVAMENHHFG